MSQPIDLPVDRTKVFLGVPGAGKTTTCLNQILVELERGVPCNRIGFFTFTRKAAKEANDRARSKFKQLTDDDFTYFRTLHSLAYLQLGTNRRDIMQQWQYKQLGVQTGYAVQGGFARGTSDDWQWFGNGKGDKIIRLIDLARIKMVELQDAFRESNEAQLTWHEVLYFATAVQKFKESNALVDFTDLLVNYVRTGIVPDLQVIFVDEAQDLSAVQWRLVEKLAAKAERVFVAGDDDQAIFPWAGADVENFVKVPGQLIVLGQSYRNAIQVHKLAQAVIAGVRNRIPKESHPTQEEGKVTYHHEIDADLLKQGEWLLLARNNQFLKEYEELCMLHGFPFVSASMKDKDELIAAVLWWERLRKGDPVPVSKAQLCYKYIASGTGVSQGGKAKLEREDKGETTMAALQSNFGLLVNGVWFKSLDRIAPEDREYMRAVLRRGESLTGIPRIKISTIHGAKGGEADNVMLLTDMTYRTYRGMEHKPEDEHRVWYVGVTRARNAVHIVLPRTRNGYSI